MLQNDDRLAELIKRRGPQPESDTSLWACLSRCVNYKDGSPLPLQSVAANAGIFFAAGYETTAHAISWALFELAADRAIQVGIFFAAGYASTAHPISWALAVSIGSRYSCGGWLAPPKHSWCESTAHAISCTSFELAADTAIQICQNQATLGISATVCQSIYHKSSISTHHMGGRVQLYTEVCCFEQSPECE